MSEAKRALALAIRRVYEAFRDAPRPQTMNLAPTHDDEPILENLTSAPLHALSADRLGSYAGSAMTTAGLSEDYLHFLPRILELAPVEGNWMGFDPPIIADKVKSAGWPAWRADRRDVVLEVFDAAFAASVSLPEPYPAHGPGQWLAGLARLTAVTGFLKQWRDTVDPWAAIHLATFRMNWMESLAEERRLPPFWEDVDIGTSAEVEAWLLSAEARQQIERALSLAPQEERWQLERALPNQ